MSRQVGLVIPNTIGFAARVRAMVELMKLRMVILILVTTAAGYYLGVAPWIEPASLTVTLLGTALLAAGAFAFNQALERDLDALMERTKARPIPSGRIGRNEAFAFGAVATLVGTAILWSLVNELTAWLGICTVLLYAAVYTPLKQISSLNTLVGAVPGAIPPLMGWTAARGSADMGGWILFALLFFWQLPHFLAISWMYRKDYARAGFKMLSVTDPSGEACFRHIVLQTLLLVLVSLLPSVFGMSGRIYLASALVAGIAFVMAAAALFRKPDERKARIVFFLSLIYLPMILLALAFDSR